jgi:REP element-mobilizing transposase RayT
MSHVAGQFYHAFNRSVSGKLLFPRKHNYLFLLGKIKKLLPRYEVVIIAYCLMPNHYHFVMRSVEDHQIGSFLQTLFNGYSQAINKQEAWHGSLFESNVKYRHIEKDAYILQLVRYIHLNPVNAKMVDHPEDWEYSNYLEWIGRRQGTLVDREFISTLFESPGEYQEFVNSHLYDEFPEDLSGYTLEKE